MERLFYAFGVVLQHCPEAWLLLCRPQNAHEGPRPRSLHPKHGKTLYPATIVTSTGTLTVLILPFLLCPLLQRNGCVLFMQNK